MSLKDECRRLKIDERLTYREIIDRTGVSKSTLSGWLSDISVSKKEMSERQRRPGNQNSKKMRLPDSKYYGMVDTRGLTRHKKGKIAEAAVLFRICLRGMNVYGSPFDGDRADWIVESSPGECHIVQVKWASMKRQRGLPTVNMRRSAGGRKQKAYQNEDFDFLVGYDLRSDTAYVFTSEEVIGHNSSVTMREDAAERWDKICSL